MEFWKKLFGDEEKMREDIQAARERHGISGEETGDTKTCEQPKPVYDPWEDVRNARMNFFFGRWASRNVFHRFNDDALKADLDKVARQREEKQRQKDGRG